MREFQVRTISEVVLGTNCEISLRSSLPRSLDPLSTIALSAAQNPVSVAFGGIAAHAVATGLPSREPTLSSTHFKRSLVLLIGTLFFGVCRHDGARCIFKSIQ
jgi:hypothetical protein